MSDTFVNPYSLVYDALWSLALRHPDFATLVKPGNRINYGGDVDRDPIKQHENDAGFPEVALSSDGVVAANIHNTSSTTSIDRRYTFVINTADFRLRHRLYRVEWFLTCAMTGWQDVLGGLTWLGKPFVKAANLASINEGMSDPIRNRGIKGWTGLWACEVRLLFPTVDLAAELTPIP